MSLPLADPQFWIVTGAAVVALGAILLRLLRRPAKNDMPCANCPRPKARMK